MPERLWRNTSRLKHWYSIMPRDMQKFLQKEGENRSLILCEYCHAISNGQRDLKGYHNTFYSLSALLRRLYLEVERPCVYFGIYKGWQSKIRLRRSFTLRQTKALPEKLQKKLWNNLQTQYFVVT